MRTRTLFRYALLALASAAAWLMMRAGLAKNVLELKRKQRTTLRDLIAQFDNWSERNRTIPHAELAQQILDESGYTQMWQNDKSPQAHSRLENLKELIRFMHEFESLQSFLEHVSLVMDVGTQDGDDRISLMTLHGAKGLEFGVVFLPGWEEGLFPHQRSLDENGQAGLEEERRLAYVGVTRAMRRLYFTYAEQRRLHGVDQYGTPSRFIAEVPSELIEEVRPRLQVSRPLHAASDRARGTARYEEPSSDCGMRLGQRVRHGRFGEGVVLRLDGYGQGAQVEVNFERLGRKVLMLAYANLEAL